MSDIETGGEGWGMGEAHEEIYKHTMDGIDSLP